jgi:hypothetical protein
MSKYRKKPVVVEAVLWNGKSGTIFPLAPFENASVSPCVNEDKTLSIETLEGVMIAQIGDYIIKGVNGEIYPIKPDIFVKTYDPVEE